MIMILIVHYAVLCVRGANCKGIACLLVSGHHKGTVLALGAGAPGHSGTVNTAELV